MSFVYGYLDFLAKVLTLVIAIIFVFGSMALIRKRMRQAPGQLQIRKLNDLYAQLHQRMAYAVLDKVEFKALAKAQAKTQKTEKKNHATRPRVYVLDFDGDIKASATDSLRHEITALLSMASPSDEVLLRLESGGGMVHSYGLASSQLARIRQAGIPLTVCIDKVAASGGYMMACIANKIISAPFALLGSIGVVAQLPNLHRWLKNRDIDFEVLTSGEYKRTLTVFGENTDKGRVKFQQDLDVTHDVFKTFVAKYRPQLDMDKVATGEVWLGINAKEQNLVDELKTSDEYLVARSKEADVFQLKYLERKTFAARVGVASGMALDSFALKWLSRLTQQRF